MHEALRLIEAFVKRSLAITVVPVSRRTKAEKHWPAPHCQRLALCATRPRTSIDTIDAASTKEHMSNVHLGVCMRTLHTCVCSCTNVYRAVLQRLQCLWTSLASSVLALSLDRKSCTSTSLSKHKVHQSSCLYDLSHMYA